MSRQTAAFCEVTDLHETPVLVTTPRKLRLRAHSKSRGFLQLIYSRLIPGFVRSREKLQVSPQSIRIAIWQLRFQCRMRVLPYRQRLLQRSPPIIRQAEEATAPVS